MRIIVSGVAVDFLIDALVGIILGVLPGVNVSILGDVNVNVFAGAMTASEFVMQGPLAEFRC